MKKLFGGIFGRAEKSAPTSTSTIIIDDEEYDIEYAPAILTGAFDPFEILILLT